MGHHEANGLSGESDLSRSGPAGWWGIRPIFRLLFLLLRLRSLQTFEGLFPPRCKLGGAAIGLRLVLPGALRLFRSRGGGRKMPAPPLGKSASFLLLRHHAGVCGGDRN
jgi:hypothetical protein